MTTPEIVDLRSDTVTRPTAEMRRAMAEAEVGDDVYGEDPTVRRLEERAAERVGHEAALFVPTGTMGNQIAVNLHTTPGSEVIVAEGSHVYQYELGAMAAWSGVLPRIVPADRGVPDPAAVAAAVAPDLYYLTPATLLVLENTHNHAGGTVLPTASKDALLETARDKGLKVHLDGARIFNAAVALDRPATELAAGYDSVMFCLSKGLGAPVGSMLCGGREWIRAARVVRKRMGGGMRQAGVLAAAGLVALERHVGSLPEDHHRARRLAEGLAELSGFRLEPESVQTNIVIPEVVPPADVATVLEGLERQGVRAGPWGTRQLRFVTHRDVDDSGLDRALAALRALERN